MNTTVLEKMGVGIIITVGVIACVAGVGLLLAWPIKWTWNATMPAIFSLPTITWGKAWCLHFLCASLLKPSFSAKAN